MKNRILRISGFSLILFMLISCQTTNFEQINSQEQIELLLNSMSLEEKIGQLFVVIPEAIDSKGKPVTYTNSSMKKNYSKLPAAGFILFKNNIKSPSQVKKLNKGLHKLGKIKPFIFVDEEGGTVARLANNPDFKLSGTGPMLKIGNTGDVEKAKSAGNYIGSYLKYYGFDVDFAPIADVNTNPQNPIIGERAFSSDPTIAGKMGQAFLEGLHQNGITGCLKHFPGHGDTQTDTHLGYAETLKDWDEIKDCEMIPFKMGIENNVQLIMTAHITAPMVDESKVPSTFSTILLVEKLRNELGYEGVIISDAMNMGAVSRNYTSEEVSVLAIKAGIDLILMPIDYKAAYESLLNAVKSGEISTARIDESVNRILNLKFMGYNRR